MGKVYGRSRAVDSTRAVHDAHFMAGFTALRIHRSDVADANRPVAVDARLESVEEKDLSAGEVLIRVAWSGINYKDALAATGAGSILRRFPLIGGVDLAGTVVESTDPSIGPGARVLVT